MTMRTLFASTVAVCSSVSGCLPADTRPEPGLVFVTADLPSDLKADENLSVPRTFETDGGWSVTVSRLLVSMGFLRFSGDGCNDYSEANYGRVLDLLQPGPQKLGQNWGLNDCLLGYRIATPQDDSVLGTGVTKRDRALMKDAVFSVSTPTGLGAAQGMTVHFQGTLANASTSVDFDWGFSGEISWTDCKRRVDGELETRLPLVGQETLTIGITVDPRNLFNVRLYDPDTQYPATDTTPLTQLIADADQVSGNANGRVAIDELVATTVPGAASGDNLGEVIRKYGYTSMFRYAADGECSIQSERRRGPGGGHGM